MKTILYTAALLLIFSFTGCRDYVEVESVGNNRELIYTSDYRDLMNSYTTMEYGWSYPLLSSDDTEFPEDLQAKVSDIWGRIYTWSDYFFEENYQDGDWSNCYKAIYYANVVTDGVMDSKSGTNEEKVEIMAEAKVHRAFAYLSLVNEYGPHYNPATADTDKAVPLLLTSDLYAELNRASVAAVYDQIIEDLTDALDALPDVPDYDVLPSKPAAHALLARAYLYMGDYQNALEHAEAALSLKDELLDFNNYASNPYSYPVKLENPEIILSKIAVYGYYGAPLQQELLDLLADGDLRLNVYTVSGAYFTYSHNGLAFGLSVYSYTNGVNIGPSVPEMYLIKAECEARLSDASGAISTINALRAKRFDSSADYEIVLNSDDEALDYVLRERRIELMGRGFRWFDMKRFNLESGRELTMTRTYRGEEFTLEPNGAGYVYPIYQDYIDLNPELGN